MNMRQMITTMLVWATMLNGNAFGMDNNGHKRSEPHDGFGDAPLSKRQCTEKKVDSELLLPFNLAPQENFELEDASIRTPAQTSDEFWEYEYNLDLPSPNFLEGSSNSLILNGELLQDNSFALSSSLGSDDAVDSFVNDLSDTSQLPSFTQFNCDTNGWDTSESSLSSAALLLSTQQLSPLSKVTACQQKKPQITKCFLYGLTQETAEKHIQATSSSISEAMQENKEKHKLVIESFLWCFVQKKGMKRDFASFIADSKANLTQDDVKKIWHRSWLKKLIEEFSIRIGGQEISTKYKSVVYGTINNLITKLNTEFGIKPEIKQKSVLSSKSKPSVTQRRISRKNSGQYKDGCDDVSVATLKAAFVKKYINSKNKKYTPCVEAIVEVFSRKCHPWNYLKKAIMNQNGLLKDEALLDLLYRIAGDYAEKFDSTDIKSVEQSLKRAVWEGMKNATGEKKETYQYKDGHDDVSVATLKAAFVKKYINSKNKKYTPCVEAIVEVFSHKGHPWKFLTKAITEHGLLHDDALLELFYKIANDQVEKFDPVGLVSLKKYLRIIWKNGTGNARKNRSIDTSPCTTLALENFPQPIPPVPKSLSNIVNPQSMISTSGFLLPSSSDNQLMNNQPPAITGLGVSTSSMTTEVVAQFATNRIREAIEEAISTCVTTSDRVECTKQRALVTSFLELFAGIRTESAFASELVAQGITTVGEAAALKTLQNRALNIFAAELNELIDSRKKAELDAKVDRNIAIVAFAVSSLASTTVSSSSSTMQF